MTTSRRRTPRPRSGPSLHELGPLDLDRGRDRLQARRNALVPRRAPHHAGSARDNGVEEILSGLESLAETGTSNAVRSHARAAEQIVVPSVPARLPSTLLEGRPISGRRSRRSSAPTRGSVSPRPTSFPGSSSRRSSARPRGTARGLGCPDAAGQAEPGRDGPGGGGEGARGRPRTRSPRSARTVCSPTCSSTAPSGAAGR